MANSVKRKDLSKTDISWLKGYIGIIQKTVLAFYSKIESVYSGYSNILYSQSAKDEKVKTNELIKQISRLIAAGRGQQTFIDEIYDHVAQMYENLSEFVNSNKSDTDFVEQVKNSHIASEIKNQDKILGRIENLGEKKSGESEYLPTNLKDLGWTAAYALGPVGPALKSGLEMYKAGKSGINWAKRKISDFADSRKMNQPSSDKKASPLGRAMGATPFDLGETIQEASESDGRGPDTSSHGESQSSKGISPITPSISSHGELRSPTGQYAKGNTPWNKGITPQVVETSGTSKEQTGLIDNFEHGLFKFFSTTAKRAPYTKELLEAVQGKGPEKEKEKKEEKSGLFGLGGLGDIGKLIGPMLGPILAVALAGIGGALLGKFINEKLGVGKAIQGAIAKDSTNKTNKKNWAGMDPLAAKADELMEKNPGMKIGDAIKQAQGELQSSKPSSKDVNLGKVSIKKSAMDFGELDDATGLPKDKSKMEAFQKQSRIETLGPELAAQESKSESMRKSVEKVPVDTTKPDVQKGTKEGIDKLHSVMSEINNTLKDGSKNTSQKKPSGYDANNTRNPLLSSLGAGILDIA